MELTTAIDINKELIDQCKLGSQSAYSQIYQNCARGVFGSIIRIVENREEAEDLLQETFVSAFQNIQNFRGDASLFGWIKKIGVNKSLNAVKKRQIPISETDIAELDIYTEETNWDDVTIQASEVAKKIQLLPDGFRIVISLFLFEGYSHKEIASELGISESTSKTQYIRGKKKLRELLTHTNQ
ncbi:MAG: RNA polymerase sigma factor (sigma-70 family) [Flavobacteriales bacterium]